jgi:hypothetical protein
MVRGHASEGLPCAVEIAERIHGEHLREHRIVELVEPALSPDDAGVVHQRVDLSQPAVGLVEQTLCLGRLRDVGLDRDRLAAGAGDARDHLLGRVLAVRVVDADGVAALSRELRDGGADALAGAGDDHDLGHQRSFE